jgi:hypothetical protein
MSAQTKADYYAELANRHGAQAVVAFLLSVIEQLSTQSKGRAAP